MRSAFSSDCPATNPAASVGSSGIGADPLRAKSLTPGYTAVAGGHNENWRRRSVSIAIFLVSGTAGAALTTWLGPWAPLAVSVALLTVALTGLIVRDGP